MNSLTNIMEILKTQPEVSEVSVSDPVSVSSMISGVRDRGYVILPNGDHRKITGVVSTQDAMRLASTVLANKCRITLETGVAYGFSTLAIKAAQNLLGDSCHHYAVDPEQFVTHQGAAMALLGEHGLAERCEVIPSPAHTALPDLLRQNVVLDLAFIDGWHTFDYALLDFFYIDKMLRPGGILAVHDCTMGAVQKMIRFVTTHRRYSILPFPRVMFLRSARRLFRSIIKRDSDIGFAIKRVPNLLFMRKEETWEPRWDYFRRF